MKMLTSFQSRCAKTMRLSRFLFAFAMLGGSAFVSACSNDSKSDVEPVARTLTGNWGSPHYTYASFALTETNGNITGHGWWGTGVPVTVSGRRNGENVALSLTLRRDSTVTPREFRGVFVNDALIGDIDGSDRLSLTRVDSVSKGYVESFSTIHTRPYIGNASFWRNTEAAVISLSSVGFSDEFYTRLATIKPGKYSIGPNRDFYSYYGSDGAPVGEITITTVASKMIAGSFTMSFSFNGVPASVSGTFDASCPYDDVFKDGVRCAAAK